MRRLGDYIHKKLSDLFLQRGAKALVADLQTQPKPKPIDSEWAKRMLRQDRSESGDERISNDSPKRDFE